ncbi:hypothetical protein TNCV_4419641 [Trichonephila clavipes]|nr:hypothetical protein TNCV_4419641 [Trichonephila clavipes]
MTASLQRSTLSTLHIPFIFLKLIGNIREFIFPKKTPKKISGKVPYRFVTNSATFSDPEKYTSGKSLNPLVLLTSDSYKLNLVGCQCDTPHPRVDISLSIS